MTEPCRNGAAEKLEQSRRAAENREARRIRCPQCGFYLLDVYGWDHCLVRVKCRKCKFNETIDTALFRTVRKRPEGRAGGKNGRKIQGDHPVRQHTL